MRRPRRYSSTEFDRGAALSRMDPSTIDYARQVLVEGRRQADVAREVGVIRQRVSAVVKQMLAYIDEANPVPPGWKADTVVLPVEDWPRVREMEKVARDALARGQKRKKQRRRR